MALSELELSQLIASRLNHDYVAPLTAISNSCELLQLSPESTDECIELITESVEAAIELLQYYRLAFGVYSVGEEISFADTKRRIAEVIRESGCDVQFGHDTVAIMKGEAKLLALGLLCLRSSFLKMQSVTIDRRESTWVIAAQGRGREDADDLKMIENLWHGLAEVKASNVHFTILARELEIQKVGLVRKKPEPNAMIIELAMDQ